MGINNHVNTIGIAVRNLWRMGSAFFVLYLLAVACAQPSIPEGGPLDTKPPRLHSKRYSTPNESTNFPYQRVILTFDEWVKLQRAQQQVVISPPLETPPNITLRNKSVVISWKEPLKDSTTYLVQFGDAVTDITENNVVKNLQLVFSTGPYLDSLTCSGEVLRADTRKPADGVWVMLYRDLADSLPLTRKPYYFTKTNNSGRFQFNYLREGQYRIFALAEQRPDYIYNSPQEEIGFLDSSFVINDTLQPSLSLLLFQERLVLRVGAVDVDGYGQARLTLNQELTQPLEVDWLGEAPSQYRFEQGADSLRVWYEGGEGDTLEYRLQLYHAPTEWRDTVTIKGKSRKKFFEKGSAIRWYVPRPPSKTEQASTARKGARTTTKEESLRPTIDTAVLTQHPFEPLALDFTFPVAAWDRRQMEWLADTIVATVDTVLVPLVDTSSLDTIGYDTTLVAGTVDTFAAAALPPIARDSQQMGRLWLSLDTAAGRRYVLRLLPGAVTDFWGRPNTDTLSRIYQIGAVDQYGSLTLRLIGADSSKAYLIELLDNQQTVLRRTTRQDSSAYVIVYPYLPVGSYTLRLNTDLNKNGRWDVGNYLQGRQPEPRRIESPTALKAGWDNEFKVDLRPAANKLGSNDKGKKNQTNEQEEAEPTQEEEAAPPKKGKGSKIR